MSSSQNFMLNSLPRSNLSNSPFRYPGGKFYARKIILNEIPEHNFYCEPFAGGASIFFAKKCGCPAWLNDLDDDVINTFIQIRDRVEDLISHLTDLNATKDNHSYYKNIYQPANEIQRAFRWYYLNRTSYSGIMKPENCYWGYGEKYSMKPENWPPHLRTVSDKLQGVTLTSWDFERVIDRLPDDAFAFIDPPYYNADQKKFYNCSFDIEDHLRLKNCIHRNSERVKFLLTYDDHSDIHKFYSWAESREAKQWNYTINRTDDQKSGMKLVNGHKGTRGLGSELFIRNYHA